jgi:hypothetical protein
MGIEVNYEKLSKLSISDLLALNNKFEEWDDPENLEIEIAISNELTKRINDIFIY